MQMLELDDDELFGPAPAVVVDSPLAVEADPDLSPPGCGFSNACHTFTKVLKPDGEVKFSATVSAVRFAGQPVRPFWEARDFYNRIGFSSASDDVNLWSKRKHNKSRMDELYHDFGLDPKDHYIDSQKIAKAKDPRITEDELHANHDIEIMATTMWVLIFFTLSAN